MSAASTRRRRDPRRLGRALRSSISSPRDLVTLASMAVWAFALPILKRVLPLPTLARLAWTRPRLRERDLERERQAAGLAHRLYRSRLIGDDNCLERSLVAYRFLARLNADPHLGAAVRNGEEGFVGHVWVAVDGEPLTESPADLAEYTPIVVFGDGGAARMPVVTDRPS